MEIQKWASRYINDSGMLLIEQAVKSAESKTSGEIVPIVVKCSSAIGRVYSELMQLSLLFVVIAYIFSSTYFFVSILNALIIVCLVVSVLLSFYLSKLDFVQRIFTNPFDREKQVNMRAEVEFFEAKLSKTRARTGILLFCSLMEQRAVVLADKAISEKLPQDTWNEVLNLIIEGMKQGDIAKGYVQAIERCGEILASHFPIEPDDTNELNDGLILKV